MGNKIHSGSAILHYHFYNSMNQQRENIETILLVHGLGMDSRYWYRIVPMLTKGYNVVTFDLRGHGQSTGGSGKITWSLLLKDLLEVINQLELTSVHVIGHGLGANLSIQLAYNYPTHIKTLTIISTLIHFPNKAVNEIEAYRKSLVSQGSLKLLADYMIPKIIIHKNNPDKELLYSCYERIPISTYFEYFKTSVTNELNLEEISTITTSTLILSGEFDSIIPPKISGLSTFTFSNNHFFMVPNAANAVFLDQPLITADSILSFIKGKMTATKTVESPTQEYIEIMANHINKLFVKGIPRQDNSILNVCLLDSFSVSINGVPLQEGWNQRMAKQLFSYLIVHRVVLREQICDDLLPHTDIALAKRNLRVYLHHLKKIINQGDNEFIRTDHEHVYLTEHVQSDINDFLLEIQYLENNMDPTHNLESIYSILKKVPRTILTGVYDEWAIGFREKVQKRLTSLALQLSSFYFKKQDYKEAANIIELVMEYDTIEPSTYEYLIKIYEAINDNYRANYWRNRYEADFIN